MRKNKFLLVSTLSLLPVALTIGVIAGTSNLLPTLGENVSTWVHYEKKNNTIDRRGNKEYWVSCSTHEHQFTAPEVDPEDIREGGVLNDSEIYSMATNDDRVLLPNYDVIDFEDAGDANLISSVRNNFASKTIVDGGAEGKCLELVWKDGTADFALADEYLDKWFADPNVVSIAYDIKTEVSFDPHYYNGSSQVRYYGNGHSMYCTRTNYFKTVAYSRSAYETYKKPTARANAMLWDAITAGKKVYIDNIRPITSWDFSNIGDFEGGGVHDDTISAISFRTYTGANTEQLGVWGGSSFELSGKYSTSGRKSAKITATNTNVKLIINPNFKTNMGDNDYLAYDVRIEAVSPADFAGYNSSAITVFGTAMNKGGFLVNNWYTIKCKKSECTNTDAFSVAVGGRTVNFYFDNVRIIKAGNAEIDFEQDGMIEASANADYYYNWNWNTTNHAGFQLHVTSTDNKAITDFKTTKSIKSEGSKSLMISKKSGYIAFFISSELKAKLTDGKKLQFDLYSTMSLASSGSDVINDGMNHAMPNAHNVGVWNTYELTVDKLTSDGRFLIITGSTSGDIYLDNFNVIA